MSKSHSLNQKAKKINLLVSQNLSKAFSPKALRDLLCKALSDPDYQIGQPLSLKPWQSSMKSAALKLLFVILGKVLFFQAFAKICKIY